MPKKRMTAQDRRQSIIDATISVIARLNYETATTALIAKEAGVNEALIYAHFKSKKELQLAMLDYLIKYRLGIYRSNPVFKPENKDQSIVKAINAQYLERIQRPDVNMFSCLLKSIFAIDEDIRKKGMDCAIALYEFNKQNLIEDGRRGFYNNRFDPDTIAWELLGSVLLVSTLAVSGRLDAYGIERIKKSLEYFEAVHMTNT